jgi:diadenosine tetraphosphate (Ap4A) HIT family hydrolase
MQFDLHPNFFNKIVITDLPLCRVLLEDERNYPWLLLQVTKIMDLPLEDQHQLTEEIDKAQHVLWDTFEPFQLNVAAIGNKTPQLHIHIIARFQHDPAWPNTVWDHPIRERYSPEKLYEMQQLLQTNFEPQKAKSKK